MEIEISHEERARSQSLSHAVQRDGAYKSAEQIVQDAQKFYDFLITQPAK